MQVKLSVIGGVNSLEPVIKFVPFLFGHRSEAMLQAESGESSMSFTQGDGLSTGGKLMICPCLNL